MNVIEKIGLSILALSTVAVCASVTALDANNAEPTVVGGDASSKTVTITNADLLKVSLSDLDGGHHDANNDKGDQKFIIPLDGGKCIHGAIIFNDCGHQFVGDTLGDAFGIDNTYSGAGQNACNFNFLFSFDKAIQMSTTLTIKTKETGVGDVAELCTKFIYSTVASGTDFFKRFTKGEPSVYDYDKIKKLPDNAWDYYGTDAGQYAASPRNLSESSINVTTSADTGTDGTYNVAAFQFTYDDVNFIEIGNKISCTLESLTFKYSCN